MNAVYRDGALVEPWWTQVCQMDKSGQDGANGRQALVLLRAYRVLTLIHQHLSYQFSLGIPGEFW